MMAVLDGSFSDATLGEVLAACEVLLPLLEAQEDEGDGEWSAAALAVLSIQFKAIEGLKAYERSLFRYRAPRAPSES